ncbi:uncharacterized protein LOC119735486 [Patiria miniata]|uniref:Uncharacterized protein n=1 Tax=Patiria miniata TaxID=46514 RepID=A0A914ANV5_PATMI|nr:uncharacterized protein LOC119735486 [Patiria miniata]
MAAKMFFVILALAVLTAFVMASEEDEDFADHEALYEMVKRGRKGRKGARGNPFFNCEDEFGNPGCVCDRRKGGVAVTCG